MIKTTCFQPEREPIALCSGFLKFALNTWDRVPSMSANAMFTAYVHHASSINRGIYATTCCGLCGKNCRYSQTLMLFQSYLQTCSYNFCCCCYFIMNWKVLLTLVAFHPYILEHWGIDCGVELERSGACRCREVRMALIGLASGPKVVSFLGTSLTHLMDCWKLRWQHCLIIISIYIVPWVFKVLHAPSCSDPYNNPVR